MKLSVLTAVLYSTDLEGAFRYLTERGVHTVELPTGGYVGNTHIDPAKLLADEAELEKVRGLLAKYDMEISAFSCHGNPVHPNREIAEGFNRVFEDTVRLAEKLGVPTVVTFSGCPGDCPESKYPNWVTCPWPDDFLAILDYQWNEVLIPYWKKAAAFAEAHGVHKIALELHPGFCCYNPETLLKLRAAVGPTIGANLDPSHFFWQGINIVSAIRTLGDAIYHFHAKDTKVDALNTGKNGVLDTKHYSEELDRSWIFRTVGYGHGEGEWRDILSNLRMVGYNGAISIEHEDGLMSAGEGLDKAIEFLKPLLMYEDTGAMWWA